MADKKITELQLRDNVSADVNFPCDDAIQSYRVTAQQIKDYVLAAGNVGNSQLATDSVTTNKILDLNVTTEKINNGAITLPKLDATVTAGFLPTGCVVPFAAASAPTGYLLCDGAAVSRTTYATLYALIGNAYGSGDGSTTFNVPDLRYSFIRGRGPNTSATGSGTASSNNATFTAHGYNRTGLGVRLSSGTLSGLSTNTDYWVIVIDANTLAFATTRANALAGTKITISGSNSAVIVQNMDDGAGSRVALQSGGNTGDSIGSYQEDQLQNHKHNLSGNSLVVNGGGNPVAYYGTGAQETGDVKSDGVNGLFRAGKETRPKNVTMNYIIKT